MGIRVGIELITKDKGIDEIYVEKIKLHEINCHPEERWSSRSEAQKTKDLRICHAQVCKVMSTRAERPTIQAAAPPPLPARTSPRSASDTALPQLSAVASCWQ